MKKHLLLALTILAFIFAGTNTAKAQFPTPPSLIWGCSPFQDSLWSHDSTTFSVIDRVAPSTPGFTITGMTGMAVDPTTGITYVIMKLSGVTGRVLGTMSLPSGVCTQVGNLGTNFASITFDKTGQLWGATGNGGTPSETLFKIDKATGVTTLQYAMGSGLDGEILLYNKLDDMMYHWSGNGTVVYESWPVNSPVYAPTNIVTSGTVGGETFGALFIGSNNFIVSNISSNYLHANTTGVYGPVISSNPDDLRGPIMPPRFGINQLTACSKIDTIKVGGVCLQLFDSLSVNWGDGNTSVVSASTNAAGAAHAYMTAGTYTVTVQLINNAGLPSTITPVLDSYTVTINTTPVVAITGNPNLCPGATNILTGTSGGTRQWYMNGTLLPGETATTYAATAPGVYNMIKTNLNGCADSAAVGLTVVAVPNPTVALGNDSTQCGGTILLDAQNAGGTYVWSTTATTQTIAPSTSGTYSVTVTSAVGCTGTDAVTITINPNPVVNLGADTAQCGGSVVIDAMNAGASYMWMPNGETTQTITVSTSMTNTVTVTDANGCVGTDNISVTINTNPTVTLSIPGTQDTVCTYTAAYTLTGESPAGGVFSGTGVTAGSFDPAAAGMGTTTITYTYTDGNGCSNMATDGIYVDLCTSINEATASSFEVYPNPSHGTFMINANATITKLEVLNVLGEKVAVVNVNSKTTSIDISNQSNGVYFINVYTNDGITSKRLIKQ